jgi:FkbM family methyltransferase
MRQLLRRAINAMLGLADVRLVHRDWGPRGFAQHLRWLANSQPLAIRSVADIGASDGRWTRECMTVYPTATYTLIDPLMENEASLRAFCSERPQCRYWLGALGKEEGRLSLYVHGDQSSAYLSKEYGRHPREIRMSTLDTLLAEGHLESPPDMIKLDVQGYELDVLRGAEKSLSTASLVLAELSFQPIYQAQPLADELICFLSQKKFKILDICSYVQRPKDDILCQADILFGAERMGLFARAGWGAE